MHAHRGPPERRATSNGAIHKAQTRARLYGVALAVVCQYPGASVKMALSLAVRPEGVLFLSRKIRVLRLLFEPGKPALLNR